MTHIHNDSILLNKAIVHDVAMAWASYLASPFAREQPLAQGGVSCWIDSLENQRFDTFDFLQRPFDSLIVLSAVMCIHVS